MTPARQNSLATAQPSRRSTLPLPPPPMHLNRVSQSLMNDTSSSAPIPSPQQPALSTPEKGPSPSKAPPPPPRVPTPSGTAVTSAPSRSKPAPQPPASRTIQLAPAGTKGAANTAPPPPKRSNSFTGPRNSRQQPEQSQASISDSSSLTGRTGHKWGPKGSACTGSSGSFWGTDRISSATRNLIEKKGVPFSFHWQRKHPGASGGSQRGGNSSTATCQPPVQIAVAMPRTPTDRRVSLGATNRSVSGPLEPLANAAACDTLRSHESSPVTTPTVKHAAVQGASQPLPPLPPLNSSPPRTQPPHLSGSSQPLPARITAAPPTPPNLECNPSFTSGELPPWNSNTDVSTPPANSFSSFPCPKPGNPPYTRTTLPAGVRQPPPIGRVATSRTPGTSLRLLKTPSKTPSTSHTAAAISPCDDTGAVLLLSLSYDAQHLPCFFCAALP
jgi:hypothetical protein